MKKNLFFIFCFFTFGLTAQIPTYIPTNGLVGYWPFTGNANDVSGNGNNGTVSGATLTTDRFGNPNAAYDFDGITNKITLPTNSNIQGNNPRSILFWVFISNSTPRINIFYKGGTNGDGNDFSAMLRINSGNTYQILLRRYIDDVHSDPIPLVLNQWTHFSIVYDGTINSNIKFYINGTEHTGRALTGSGRTFNTAPTNPEFGHLIDQLGDHYYMNGKLDDIGIYNRALTQQEIIALYQSCTTPTASITPQSNTNFCQGNNVVLNATTGTNYTYEWYNNGSLINGAATNSFTATTAGNYTVKVIDGSCNATSSATTLSLIDTVTWTGNVDNDWHKPCNWSPEVVPECCNSVKIPFTPISPVVSGVGKAKNVTLYSTSGATLTVNNGANLQIETCPVTKTQNSCPTLPVLTTTVISSATQTSAVSGGNITYTGASSITARGICWSTTNAPTISNSKTTDGSGIGTYTSNLTGLTAGTTYYVRAYATNASGTSYGNEVSFIAVNPQPAYSLGSVFCNGTPTLVIDVTNPTTGKTWMDRNLGASQAATSSSDALAYGDLYQWGRGSDGHQCRNSGTTSTLSSADQPGHSFHILAPSSQFDWRNPQNTNLWQGANGINNPCPIGYRIPTETELNSDKNSWSNTTINAAFSSYLKFTTGGYRNDSNGSLTSVGLIGYFWSSSINGNSSSALNVNSSSIMNNHYRAAGFSIRCIKN